MPSKRRMVRALLWFIFGVAVAALLSIGSGGCGNITVAPDSQLTTERRGNADTDGGNGGMDSGTVGSGDSGSATDVVTGRDAVPDVQCTPGTVYPCDTGLCQCPEAGRW